MIRKWEWIRDFCNREHFEEAAEIADQIDRVLCYIYGEENTKEWEEYVTNGNLLDFDDFDICDIQKRTALLKIIKKIDFCIACVIEKNECYYCGFQKLTGFCHDKLSLYCDFRLGLQAMMCDRRMEMVLIGKGKK